MTGFGSGVVTVGIKICTPVKPMLAEPCRSVDFAFKRFPNVSGFKACICGQIPNLFNCGLIYLTC